MHVVNGLPGVSAGVEDHTVSSLGDPFCYRYRMRLRGHLGEHSVVSRDGGQVAIVISRNHQHMSGRLRIYVAECECAFALKYERSRYLAGGDSAK